MRAKFEVLFEQARSIWLSGGWAMIAIAVVALGMFGVGVSLWVRLRQKGFRSIPERTWRHWIDHPEERRGPLGRLLDTVTVGRTMKEIGALFQEVRTAEIVPFERDLRLMKICVGAAPLVGLLGTVTGMLATFGALSSGSGGEKTMALMAGGISEALITTETGLVIALPGLFFQYQLTRRHERYRVFLAHLETVCTQALYRRGRSEKRERIQRAARTKIARKLHRALQGQARNQASSASRASLQGPEAEDPERLHQVLSSLATQVTTIGPSASV